MEPIQVRRFEDRNKVAYIALVLGIVGVFSAWVFALVGTVCGGIGLVLGLIGRKSEKGNLAIVGMALSGLAIGFSLLHALFQALLMVTIL